LGKKVSRKEGRKKWIFKAFVEKNSSYSVHEFGIKVVKSPVSRGKKM